MAITKPEFWLVALGFIIVMSFALLMFGNSLNASPEVTLDADSTSYLAQYTTRLDASGITAKTNETTDKKNPVASFFSLIPGGTEILTVVRTFSNVFTGLWNFFSLVFQLPTFFLATLGLDLGFWGFVVNILGTVLTLAGTIMLVRLIK